MMRLHSSLAESLDRQLARDPEDWEQTFRQMALFDLAEDIKFGFFLAYYRNFAIPSGAATLVRNGEIPARPMKRSIDTGLVIYELIACGLDSERGRQMTALLNRVHRHVPGSPEDFLYVPMTLLVVPIRWTELHGWRQPTQTERDAATRFFRELGTRIHIADIPVTFEAAAKFFDDYERRRVAPSSAGKTLMGATVQVFSKHAAKAPASRHRTHDRHHARRRPACRRPRTPPQHLVVTRGPGCRARPAQRDPAPHSAQHHSELHPGAGCPACLCRRL
jgi:hypothetical protein